MSNLLLILSKYTVIKNISSYMTTEWVSGLHLAVVLNNTFLYSSYKYNICLNAHISIELIL